MSNKAGLPTDLIKPGPSEKFAAIIQKNLAEKRARQKERLERAKKATWSIISWPFRRLLIQGNVPYGLRNKFNHALDKLSWKFYNTGVYEIPAEQKPKLALMVFQRALPMATAQGAIIFYLGKFGLKVAHCWWVLSSKDKVFSVVAALMLSILLGGFISMMCEEGVLGRDNAPRIFKSLRYVYYYLRLRLGLGKKRFLELTQS